jgi:hypothetical protein
MEATEKRLGFVLAQIDNLQPFMATLYVSMTTDLDLHDGAAVLQPNESLLAPSIKINASTLYDMFTRLRSVDSSREWVDEFLWAELNIDPSKKRKSDSPRIRSTTELAEHDSLAKELFKLGTDYSLDVLIGIDPGMRSLVTAVTVGRLRCPHRKRGGGHHRRGARRAQRKQKVTEISTREYRHMARMNDFQC